MLTCSATCSCGHHWEQSWALKSTQAMQALQLPCAWGRTSADAFQHRSGLRCWFRDSSAGKCACSAVTAHPEHMAALWAPAPQHLVARSCSPSSLFVLFITPFKHYSVFFFCLFFFLVFDTHSLHVEKWGHLHRVLCTPFPWNHSPRSHEVCIFLLSVTVPQVSFQKYSVQKCVLWPKLIICCLFYINTAIVLAVKCFDSIS